MDRTPATAVIAPAFPSDQIERSGDKSRLGARNRGEKGLMATKDQAKAGPITIKKYANRRLYNTATSSYVTLDHLCQMVKEGDDFVVFDAKTGEDITRSVLTHIIVEEESKGQTLLPISFLRQLIGMYGDNMQWMVPRYLDHSMQMFARNQEQMRAYFQQAMSGMFPFAAIDEMGKQNAAVFERAMQMFSPFPIGGADSAERAQTAPAPAAPAKPEPAPAAPAAGDVKGPTGDPDIDRSLAQLEENMGVLRQEMRKLDDEAAAAAAAEAVEQAASDAAAEEVPAARNGAARRTATASGGGAKPRSRARAAAGTSK